MIIENIRQSIKNPKFRYGGYAALVTIVVFAMLIFLNLVADQIPLKWDLSDNQLFSLSQPTYTAIKDLKQPVDIYGLYQAGKEDSLITEILKKYSDHSKKIRLKYIDPNKNPGFLKQYTQDGKDLSEGSLIVTSGARFKLIPAADLFNFDTSDPYQQQVSSLAVEQRVTGAIMYLNSAKNPVIYTLQGHQEANLPEDVTKQLETENYTVKDLTLFTNPIPQDANLLMAVSPKQDLTADEGNKIREFLGKNGRAIFLMDLTGREMPNFQKLFKSYGVSLNPLVVVETDNSLNAGNPVLLLPKLAGHPILDPLKTSKMPILIPGAQAIKILDLKKQSLTIEPLLSSSDNAWGKTDLASASLEKGKADPAGPFDIAAAITDKTGEQDGDTKIILVANASFLDLQFTARVPGNVNFLTNSLNWLQDKKEGLSIQPKSLMSFRLRLNGFQTILFSGIVIILIPLAIFGAGLTIWLRRRHL